MTMCQCLMDAPLSRLSPEPGAGEWAAFVGGVAIPCRKVEEDTELDLPCKVQFDSRGLSLYNLCHKKRGQQMDSGVRLIVS